MDYSTTSPFSLPNRSAEVWATGKQEVLWLFRTFGCLCAVHWHGHSFGISQVNADICALIRTRAGKLLSKKFSRYDLQGQWPSIGRHPLCQHTHARTQVFRRLFRVYAHIYYDHFDVIVQAVRAHSCDRHEVTHTCDAMRAPRKRNRTSTPV